MQQESDKIEYITEVKVDLRIHNLGKIMDWLYDNIGWHSRLWKTEIKEYKILKVRFVNESDALRFKLRYG